MANNIIKMNLRSVTIENIFLVVIRIKFKKKYLNHNYTNAYE